MYISEKTLLDIEDFTGTYRGMLNDPNSESPEGDKRTPPAKPGQRTYDQVNVYAKDVQFVKRISDTIKKEGYASHSIANELDQVNLFFLVMKIGLILVGTIALLIASIGIYNTMTMAVTERAQDIGIMKAIGAHPKTIRSIFLIESSYIGLQGAVIGTIIAYLVGQLVNLALPPLIQAMTNQHPPDNLQFSYIPVSLTLTCVAISLLVAVLSGMRPAKRATRVDVLKALRRDI